MDIRSRARTVGDYVRTVIGTGKRSEGRAPSRRPTALPVSVSSRRSQLPGCRLQLLQFADSVWVHSQALLPVPLGQPQTRPSLESKRLCTGRGTPPLFAYASVLADWPGGRDAAPAAGAGRAGRG